MLPTENLINRRFGKLVVTGFAGYLAPRLGSARQATWTCRCDCGQIKRITANSLKAGNTKSCGCVKKNKKSPDYLRRKWYYEKSNGTLCEAWLSYAVFEEFMTKVGWTNRMKIRRRNRFMAFSPTNFFFD